MWTLSSGTWSLATIAGGTPGAGVSSASCWARGACIAVGSKGEVDDATGLALELSSGSWQTMPLPSGIYALVSVSCSGPTFCMAIGWAARGTDDVAVLWNGLTWQEVALAPTTYSTSLYVVSCPTASFCMAVGSGASSPIAEKWNGTAWLVTTTPEPPRGTSKEWFNSVACTSADFCLAVDDQSSCCGAYGGGASAWDGTAWSSVPGAMNQVQLVGVSCATPAACVVVGGSGPSDLEPVPIEAVVARWTGATLTALRMNGIGKTSFLDGVSCTRPGWCAAVGWFTTKSGILRPLAERLNGADLARMWVPL